MEILRVNTPFAKNCKICLKCRVSFIVILTVKYFQTVGMNKEGKNH